MAMHKDAAAMAEAALKSLPSEGASEASRLMILCRKCVQVGSMPAPILSRQSWTLLACLLQSYHHAAKGIHG